MSQASLASVTTFVDYEPRDLTPEESALLASILSHHEISDVSRLAYACLDCGSVGQCESREARDGNWPVLDYTCCGSGTTVTFLTNFNREA